jgi:parvulin-like peptidyl-prolyl isomerase
MMMMKSRLVAVLVAVLLAATVAACGGDSDSVPSNAVAVVGGETVTKAQFNGVIELARRTYKAQKQPFPEEGTPGYDRLKGQVVQYLVQRAQLAQKAEELDIEVSDEQVDARLAEIKKQFGTDKQYRARLAAQGLNEEQLKSDIKAQLISEQVFKKVTKDVTVSEDEVAEYYRKNRNQYQTPQSREVRHILVKQKALADRLYTQLTNGGNFTALVKRYSQDQGSKARGGKLTAARGQTVPQFEQAAFRLSVNELSRPVKTQFGYHIIEALGPIKPKRLAPLAQVKEPIRQQLVQTKKSEAMTKWVEETKKDFEDETRYQAGYEPTTTGTTATTER